VHSALEVGLLRAKMMGRSLKEAMDLTISSVKAPATAATPVKIQENGHKYQSVSSPPTDFPRQVN